MMDANTPPTRLSEISHLFLSDVRDRHTDGAPRPQRKAPGTFSGDVSVDLTPEEFARSFGGETAAASFKPVRAVIAHHLGEKMAERVRDFAAAVTGPAGRCGIIYAAAGDVRIGLVEQVEGPVADNVDDEPAVEAMDPIRLHETLVELNCDVDAWLLVLPDPRENGARELLKSITHWTLLTGNEHDAVVSTYRTLKGVCDLGRPTLSVAISDAQDDADVQRTFRKLASVCQQFLQVDVALFGGVPAVAAVEHVALHASDSGSGDGQWSVLQSLVAAAAPVTAAVVDGAVETVTTVKTQPAPKGSPAMKIQPVAPVMKEIPAAPAVAFAPQVTPAVPTLQIAACDADGMTNVIDLPDADASPAAILAAVIRGGGTLAATPVTAPQLAEAVVAVSRDHHLVLVAVARPGLLELRNIAAAYRWMAENKNLIAMAVPQFAIDPTAAPQLHLLIDHADLGTGALDALLGGGDVTVTAYRKLRWAGRTGLLLEAA